MAGLESILNISNSFAVRFSKTIFRRPQYRSHCYIGVNNIACASYASELDANAIKRFDTFVAS